MPESINLKFKPEVLDYICKVLAQRPWAEVNEVLTDIQKQANAKGEAHGPEPVSAG